MNKRDFNRHIRIKERQNNAESLESYIGKSFDYINAAEPLEDKVKKLKKASAGRRAGGYGY